MYIDYKNTMGKSITEFIRERSSIRTYEVKKLSEEVRGLLLAYMGKVEGPFEGKVRFELIDSESFQDKEGVKLGTYGVINGASNFIVPVVEKGTDAMVKLGFELEEIIIYATALGLGTCWLGGTFKRGEFSKAVGLKENELLPIISPIGYIKGRKSIMDSLVRLVAKSNKRKPFNEIFFSKDFTQAINLAPEDKWFIPLEMVRIAPSASNKQPWRIIKEENDFHFYLQHNIGYGESLGFEVQKIDMGIAMCHFELTLTEIGLGGSWQVLKKGLKASPKNVEYIASWIS